MVLQEKLEVLFHSTYKIGCDDSQYSGKVDLIIA